MSSIIADFSTSGVAPNSRITSKPRVLFVASTRHLGGLEVASVRLAEMLMRIQPDAQEILFACRPGKFVERECRDAGIQTRPFKLANSGDMVGVVKLASLILRERIDIVHVHSRRDFVAARLAVSKLRSSRQAVNVKLVFHLHLVRNLGVPTLFSGRFFASTVDRFLAVSNTVKNHILKAHKQVSPSQITVVPNGIEFDNFDRNPISRLEVREKYGIDESEFVLGMIGRLDTKGQARAIEALSRLNNSNVTLILVGAAGLKGFENKLRSTAKELGVDKKVVFCGSQQEIAPYLSAMDAMLHLPIDEAFGLAPAEAMSAGLPVIVSNCAACKELVHNRVDGIIVDPSSNDEIVNAIDELIKSSDLRAQLALEASKSIRDRFSIESQAHAITTVYSELMDFAQR